MQQHKERPVALMRVGETLWRRATEASDAAAIVLKDGVASVPTSPAGRGPTPPPPLLQLAHVRGSGTQEVRMGGLRVFVAGGSWCAQPLR
jgi:hypothetical protein